MKLLQDIKEIANEINIKRTPVITIDISRPINNDSFYEGCYEGSKIQIATPSANYPEMTARCKVAMYGDEEGNENHDMPWMYKKIVLTQEATCLHNSFGRRDVLEMVEWSNTRTVKAGDEILVIFDDPTDGLMIIRKMRISQRIDRFCSTVATLEDVE